MFSLFIKANCFFQWDKQKKAVASICCMLYGCRQDSNFGMVGYSFLCFCCFYLLGVVVNISFYIELLPMAMDRNRQPFTQCTRDHILLIENNNNQNIPELTSQQFINWNTKKNSSKLLFFSRPVFALEIFFLTTCSSGVMKNVGHAAAFWTKTA